MAASPTLVIILLAALAGRPAVAAEFYSWVDPDGVMVMTDDPARIPAATQRSRVEVHRYLDPAPGATASVQPDSVPAERPMRVEPEPSRAPELPTVLLQPPDESMRSHYVWIPLPQPLPLGAETINGYWWHPGVTSQVDAFKAFLRQHRLLADSGLPHAHGAAPFVPGLSPLPRSVNPFYDQVVRERELMVQRAFPVPPFGARPNAGVPPTHGSVAPHPR